MNFFSRQFVIIPLLTFFIIFPLTASSCAHGALSDFNHQHVPMCIMTHLTEVNRNFFEKLRHVTDAIIVNPTIIGLIVLAASSLWLQMVLNYLQMLFAQARFQVAQNHTKPRGALTSALSRGIVQPLYYG